MVDRKKSDPDEALVSGLSTLEQVDFSIQSEETLHGIVSFLDSMRAFLPIVLHVAPVVDVFRVTVNRSVLGTPERRRLHNVGQLKYPPAHRSQWGRANLPGTTVLYASFAAMTPMLELKPKPGDLVTQSCWRLNPTSPSLNIVPIFHDSEITSRMSYFHRFAAVATEHLATLDAPRATLMRSYGNFVAKQFTKPVPSDKKKDYVISAAVSNLLLNNVGIDAPEEGKVEAIVYPSVQINLLDPNIAVRPDVFDGKFSLVEARELIVNSYSEGPTGEYHSSYTARTMGIDQRTGAILWDPDKSLPEHELERLAE